MSFFDDLRARAEQSLESVGSDIQEYFEQRLTDAVVKVGEAPKGNQTAAQIAAGQTGAPSQVIVAQASPLQKFLPLIAIGAVAYFIFRK